MRTGPEPVRAQSGSRIAELAQTDRSRQAWAVGYMSAPAPTQPETWVSWQMAVEAHARRQQVPMLHVYSDEGSGDATGFARMVGAMRERAHLRSGFVGVVVVPTLEHLSPLRDESQDAIASLLRLHFGVGTQTPTSGSALAATDFREASPAGLLHVTRPCDPNPGGCGDLERQAAEPHLALR